MKLFKVINCLVWELKTIKALARIAQPSWRFLWLAEKTTKGRTATAALQTAKSTQTSTITSTFIPSHHFINNNSEVIAAAHEPERTGLESHVVVIIVLMIIVAGVALALGFVRWRHPGYIHRLRHYLGENNNRVNQQWSDLVNELLLSRWKCMD